MLKLDAFKLTDIQAFIHMLNVCETDGIKDVVVLRQRLHEYLNHSVRPDKARVSRIKVQNRYRICPSCKHKTLVSQKVDDGVSIRICKKPCGYSEVVE